MTSLAEQCQLLRANEQCATVLDRWTRIYCECGCGVWWYAQKGAGRKRKFANSHHKRMWHWKREKAEPLQARLFGEHP